MAIWALDRLDRAGVLRERVGALDSEDNPNVRSEWHALGQEDEAVGRDGA